MLRLKLSALVVHHITLPGFQMKVDFLSSVILFINKSKANFINSFNAKRILMLTFS